MDDDDNYSSSLRLLRVLIEVGQFLLIPLAIAMVAMPVVLYLMARSRQAREPFPDPQLGLKFVLAYFKTLGFHLALAGIAVLTFSVLMKSSEKSPVYRFGFALVVPASIVFAVHAYTLTRTNLAEQPLVGRLFAGWSLLVSGVIGLAGLMLVSQSLFQKGSSGEIGRLSWSIFLVYASAWIVQAARFSRAGWGVSAEATPYYPPPPGAVVPGYAVPVSPFAPPAPAGDAAYAPPPPSPFAASPFAPPGSQPPVAPTPAPAPSPFAPPAAVPTPPSTPSPFAPPGTTTAPGHVAPASPAAGTVPVPAPMAQPLAPSKPPAGGDSGGRGTPG